jgi:tetraacyldisaccharide 4'-kinase
MDAARIERVWWGGEPPSPLLRAGVPIYRGLRALHRLAYASGLRRIVRVPVPVIVVGNLVAGGSGKTPLVLALIEALRARGFRPGVVSRGYGGSYAGIVLVDDEADPHRVGDEPCLIRRRSGAAVVVGRDRAAAARRLCEEAIDVVIADDGLQNPSLHRDVEICVIDGRRRFGNGRLLPAGPLREPAAQLDRVDFRVCNGGEPRDGEIPMRLVTDYAIALAGSARRTLRSLANANRRVHAVAGIGDPQRFFDALRAHGLQVIEHPFPDHHTFRAEDLRFDDAHPVLMTEKDAVKCAAFATSRHWMVPASAVLPDVFFDAVAARLRKD